MLNSKVMSIAGVVWNSPALRQSAVATFGNVVAGVISAVAIITASRLLGPEQFGIFSVFTSLIAIGAKAGDLGLNTPIVRYVGKWIGETRKIQELLREIVLWKIVLSIVGMLLFAILAGIYLAPALRVPQVSLWVLVVVGSFILVIYEYVYILLSAFHKFGWIGVLGSVQAIIKAGLFAAFLFLGTKSLVGISTVYAIAPIIAVVIAFLALPRWVLVSPTKSSASLRALILPFTVHAGVGVVAMTLITNIDILFVQHSLGDFQTGLYAAASRIALFLGLVTAAVGGVLNNRITRYHTRHDRLLYLKKSLGIIALAAAGFLAFLPFAKLALIFTVGPEYLGAYQVLLILTANAFFSLAVVPFTSFFYGADVPEYFSWGGIIQVATIVVGNVAFLTQFGIEATAWSRFAASIVFALFTGYHVYKAMWGTGRLSHRQIE